jgi:hypothetical protein
VLGLAQCPDAAMIDAVHRLCSEHVVRLGAISDQLGHACRRRTGRAPNIGGSAAR